MIKVNYQNFINNDIIYMKKIENIRKVKQYKQYEYIDRIRQNNELHMNAYNQYIIFELKKLNHEIDTIDKCLKNMNKKLVITRKM